MFALRTNVACGRTPAVSNLPAQCEFLWVFTGVVGGLPPGALRRDDHTKAAAAAVVPEREAPNFGPESDFLTGATNLSKCGPTRPTSTSWLGESARKCLAEGACDVGEDPLGGVERVRAVYQLLRRILRNKRRVDGELASRVCPAGSL
jgi:hypothetical protein